MEAYRDLRAYLAALQHAEIVPRPDNENWQALIERISNPGRIAEIDEEAFWYFLEVLPPKFQRGSLFAFAEGAEAVRLFWRKDQKHFCRPLTWDETQTFCRLACILLPS